MQGTFTAFFSTLMTAVVVHGVQKLGHYNVDPSSITVSGISSGAAMASQFGFAHSSVIKGVGIFAGVPYMCANGGGLNLATACMTFPSSINVNTLISEANTLAASGQIDSTSNIGRQRVFVFHGNKDSTVYPESGKSVQKMYEHYGAQVATEFNYEAEHGQPTDNYGAGCSEKSGDYQYINNCNYKGSYEMLNFLYDGSLKRPTDSVTLAGDFIEFDQKDYFTFNPSFSSMAEIGFVYIPSGCKDGSITCQFHIAFHGCHQNRASVGDIFARKTGYLEVGEVNNIIILFPQTISTLANPNACWDWWAYLNIYFPTKEGNQILAVFRMLNRVVKG